MANAVGVWTAPCATTAMIASSTAAATTTRIATESSLGPLGVRISSFTAPSPRPPD